MPWRGFLVLVLVLLSILIDLTLATTFNTCVTVRH